MVSEAIYRFERSKGSRAGCQNSVCKNAGVKIQKGELRMGSLVWIKEHQTWMWKHWGCVTPLQIKNIQDQVEGLDLDTDLDILDGWEELDEDAQDKIRQAIRDGHVADEDWKGATELNRPGMKGINQRTPKKKKKAVKSEEDDDDDELEASPSKPAAKKSKKKSKADGEDEGASESAAKTKKKSTKKRKVESDISDDELVPKKKARTKKSAKAVKEEVEDGEVEDEPAPKPKTKTKSKKESKAVKKEEVAVDDDVDELVQDEPASKKTKGKPRATKAVRKEEDVDADPDNVPQSVSKSRRSARAKKEPDVDPEDVEAPALAPKAKKASRSKKQTKPEPDIEPDFDEDNATLQVKGEEGADVEEEPKVKPKPSKGKKVKKGASVKKETQEADVEESQLADSDAVHAGTLKQEDDADVKPGSALEPAANAKVEPKVNPRPEFEAEDESDLKLLAPAQLDGAADIDIKSEASRGGRVKTEDVVASIETADPTIRGPLKDEEDSKDRIKAEAAPQDTTEMDTVPTTSSEAASAIKTENSGTMGAIRKPSRGNKRKTASDKYVGPIKGRKMKMEVSDGRQLYAMSRNGRRTNVRNL